MSVLTGHHILRFWSKVDVLPDVDRCWLWTAAKIPNGYGHFKLDGVAILAHRIAYQFYFGPIPDGFELDHQCRNRGCVNPLHLEPVTHSENARRGLTGRHGFNARKTHCPYGHEYTPENTIIVKSNGSRQCRECSRINMRRYWKNGGSERRRERRARTSKS